MKPFISNKKSGLLLASTAVIAIGLLSATPSLGDTVVVTQPDGRVISQTTTIETMPLNRDHNGNLLLTPSEIHAIRFLDLDLNADGIMSTNEIGEMLFKLYDTNGNNVIDNVEYDRRATITIQPIEQHTVVYYDLNGDGRADEVQHTYETFLRDTQLTRFDTNKNGLSPREFTELHFNSVDVNNDRMIDLPEWQGTYNAAIDKANKEAARFNH